ncbi:serine/threonine protein kinase [Labilithrix luteola]|uniref:Serine/threonine protein kinase n=1 Tax=Labilithrix luteola TaxID=1391654 RepID=A0A0K1Q6N6_9BACT|nr:serine/threonine-protein kinase [Labilithrix luteola]AKV01307.1 serine/threonine protein kinase [Labilithrix luteola]
MDPAHLQPGYRLDRYELLCPLAYGGMASVWLARFGGRLGFERLVVVKMILPQYSQDPRFQEMFLDEARIASRIEHANVARILDVGEHDGNYFIVMEWVDGDSLSKMLRAVEQRKQRIPSGVLLRICADAAAGLHAAHTLRDRDGTSLGVVHRDVSPQNILVSNAGMTMLIDFGVAKARDRVSQETSAGQLKGKIRYMAPEQALGRSIDHRADVWALGAVLFELATGFPPYDGPNEVATLHKLTSGAAPSPMPPTVPPPMRAVIERALAYNPEARYATALELNLALEAAMVEIGESTGIAAVAQYTGHLLADRKASRKRAVDAAVTSAHQRDAMSRSGVAKPSQAHVPSGAVRLSSTELTSDPSFSAFAAAAGSLAGQAPALQPNPAQPLDLAEIASVPSSATLGSAAMEYPRSASTAPDDFKRQRRRNLSVALLAGFVIAGLIGTVLIISTAVSKLGKEDVRRTASSSTSPVQPPPEAPIEPPSITSAQAISTAVPAPPPTTTEAPSATPAPTQVVHRPQVQPVVRKATTAATTPPPPASTPPPPSATSGKRDHGI